MPGEPRTSRLPRLTCWLVAALTAAATPQCSREPAAPHVLLITIDTLRADHVGCYGDRAGTTPALDALCAVSTRFDPALSPAPLTLPAHATIMTGLLPPVHGARSNGAFTLAPRFTTLAERFRASGYATAAFVAALPLERRSGLDQGFDTYDDELPSPSANFGYAERPAAAVVARAIAWWRAAGPQPRFLWVHMFEPHDPYVPPPDVAARFPNDPYRGEIFAADREAGRLLAVVRAAGEWDRTIVAVTSDHGESLGEHGEATHGLLPYEATLRVPLIIKRAGTDAGGTGGPATLGEVAPTLLALARIAAPDLRLASLFDAATRGTFDAYAEAVAPALDFNWAPLFVLRRDTWKIVSGPQGRAPSTGDALYDLSRDPHETRNVAALHPDRRAAMRGALDRLRATLEAPPLADSARTVDKETRGRLAALGYAAGGGGIGPTPADAAHPEDRLWIADALNDASRLDAAHLPASVAQLERLARVDPRNHLIARRLATVYQRLGRDGDAARQFARAFELGYRDDDLKREALSLYVRAAAHEDGRGRPSRAWALLSEARALDADAPIVREAAATWLGRRGRDAEARDALETLVADAPSRASAWKQLGLLHLGGGRTPDAVRALEMARTLEADADTLFALGEAYRRVPDRRRSRDAFQAFLISADADDTARRAYAARQLQ